MLVNDYYGNKIDFDAASALMDPDICEELHDRLAPCSEQEFIDAYAEEHARVFNDKFAPYYGLAW